MRYKLNDKLVRERNFLICLNLLQKKAELQILFSVEKHFKLITNLASKCVSFCNDKKYKRRVESGKKSMFLLW